MSVLKVITGPIIRQVKRLNTQHRAASGDISPPTDRIGICLSETINALTGRADQPAWWLNAIAKVQQASIRPDQRFFGESLWPWLDNPKVRQSLRSLAANDLSGRPSLPADDQNRQTLASKYEELVGDRGTLASGMVEVILAVLIAGLQADLATNPSAQALSTQNQASTEIILARLDGVTISKKVDSSEGPAAGQGPEAAELRRIAGNFLAAGSPPSLLPLFPTASAAARKALEEFGKVRRTVTSSAEQASSAKETVAGIAALTEMDELHHLLIAPPGSGKTHALWHAAREMLNSGGLIPLFIPLGRLAGWDDVVGAVSDIAGGVTIDTLAQDPRVCVFLDGWSEFAAGYGVDERARVLRVLSRTRVVADGRHGMPVDAIFRLWVLDPPAVREVEKAIRVTFPGSAPPGPALIELLRRPLALSLFILLGGSVSTRGELLTRLHEHLSHDFDLPEAFREALAGAVASVILRRQGRSYARLQNELRERAARASVSEPVKLLQKLGTLEDRAGVVLPVHDLYWAWLGGLGLLMEDRISISLPQLDTRECYDLALESGELPTPAMVAAASKTDITLAAALSAHLGVEHATDDCFSVAVKALFEDTRLPVRCRAAVAALRSDRSDLVRAGLAPL